MALEKKHICYTKMCGENIKKNKMRTLALLNQTEQKRGQKTIRVYKKDVEQIVKKLKWGLMANNVSMQDT